MVDTSRGERLENRIETARGIDQRQGDERAQERVKTRKRRVVSNMVDTARGER
jgi:hypothetical protein